ncbi:MAG: 50S ribosomal protein L30 [Nitrospira sp.]|nr:50S ribosomal protein L30 [Nitrospira sp.]MBX3339297.1 50S ribosomal protein L30 [Nitrospira sp.]MCW5778926.1 50S ribosomal protein L30 [Nitrospira sp.]HMZ54673.1 50S ribosomal protein L30 [Nitrospira sp.]HND03827.1 50S ribosomal protein L30 [Nitrospira sp.]
MTTENKSASSQQSLRITLKRSPIGTPYKHRLVLRGLGLRKLNATVLRPASDQVKGMIAKVGYLLEVSPQ